MIKSSHPIRIVVIDDSPLVCAGIRVHLREVDDLFIAAEAADAKEGLTLIEAAHPDVALIDLTLPGMDGSVIAARARRIGPDTKNIIIITGALSAALTCRRLPQDVDAYFHKSESLQHLVTLIRRVHRGNPCCVEPIDESADRFSSLTLREHEVLAHLAGGSSLKQVARRMQTTEKVVDHVNQSLMNKLGIHDRVGLVRLAIREFIGNESGTFRIER